MEASWKIWEPNFGASQGGGSKVRRLGGDMVHGTLKQPGFRVPGFRVSASRQRVGGLGLQAYSRHRLVFQNGAFNNLRNRSK